MASATWKLDFQKPKLGSLFPSCIKSSQSQKSISLVVFFCFARDLLIFFCVILYRKDTVGGLKARHQTTNNKRVILNERLQTRILNERPQMKDAKRIDFEQNPKRKALIETSRTRDLDARIPHKGFQSKAQSGQFRT